MSEVTDFANPFEPELSKQDVELLVWLQNTTDDG